VDRTVIIGVEEETGKGATRGTIIIGTAVIGTLVGIIIVIITGMAVEIGVIHIATGMATNTILVKGVITASHVSMSTATVLRMSREVPPGDSVTTTRLDLEYALVWIRLIYTVN